MHGDDAKRTTDDYRQLDVRALRRLGCLRAGCTHAATWTRRGRPGGTLHVTACHDDGPDPALADTLIFEHGVRYRVRVLWTPNTFGGLVPWVVCPVRGCGRRVLILYGGKVFACRHCQQLVYPSQRENESMRAMRRADKIRVRLGWGPGIGRPSGGKPKWMRWPTFARLRDEHDRRAAHAGHVSMTQPAVIRACAWLERVSNADP